MLWIAAGRKISAHPKQVAVVTFLVDFAVGGYDYDLAVVSLHDYD